jgi:uncharacterized membrane protein
MNQLALAAVLFVVTHLGISSTPLRGVLVRTIGERGYLGLYSVIAFAAIIFLVVTFNRTAQFDYLWGPDPTLRWVPLVVMPIAFIFLLGGFLTRNPTAVGQEAQVKVVGEGSGLVRITRHPFQWAVVLWAVTHIIANGDLASLVFFGSFGAVSFLGTFLMDRKKAVQLGADWQAFAGVTSNIPFAAILTGRNRLVLSELWQPMLIGLAGYALLLWGHEFVSGVALI